jgi:hypothetical protein
MSVAEEIMRDSNPSPTRNDHLANSTILMLKLIVRMKNRIL